MSPPLQLALAGAASTSVREVLTGSDQHGQVLGVYPSSAYVLLPRTVVALLGPGATRLPNGVLVTDGDVFGALQAGQPAVVGRRQLLLGSVTVRVARWWSVRPRRPLVAPDTLAADGERLAGLAGAPPVPPDRVRALHTRDPDLLHAAAYDLLGLGPGLTPSGDDVVAGVLVGLRRLGLGTLADRTGPAVAAAARRRTTALSAALLEHAARGEAADPALDVVDALAGHGSLVQSASRLFALGHTSGRDLAAGIAIAAGTVAGTIAETVADTVAGTVAAAGRTEHR